MNHSTEIIRIPLGLYKTNCYIVKEGNESIIIDPGYHGHKIEEALGDSKPHAILLTHGHADHIGAVDYLVDTFSIPVYLHENDDILLRTKRRLPSVYKEGFKASYIPIKEGEIQIGSFPLYVYETPGHSAGSVIYRYKEYLFTGDTLFKGTIGKYTTFNGHRETLQKTLERIAHWNREWIVYPGHSDETTIGYEVDTNMRLHALLRGEE